MQLLSKEEAQRERAVHIVECKIFIFGVLNLSNSNQILNSDSLTKYTSLWHQTFEMTQIIAFDMN